MTVPAHSQRQPVGLAKELGYSRRDWEIVDYQLFKCPLTGLLFRGPQRANLRPGEYFVALGAAQTFGCFCELPFPKLMEARLGLPSLNLGIGGAGPDFFLKNAALMDHVNKARFAVIQVMSGRSESNSVFETDGHEFLTLRESGLKLGADKAYTELLSRHAGFSFSIPPGHKFHALFGKNAALTALIAETRAHWCRHYEELLSLIRVPKIVLYISRRRPDYTERYNHVRLLMGDFPQLVNRQMIEFLRPLSDSYVECVTRRGSPQRLINRFTGQPTSVDLSLDRADFKGRWSKNVYYPSPEMHEDAAESLIVAAKDYVQ